MSTTFYKPFPVISVEGDAHACGVQHGERAAERVAKTIDFYLGVFGRRSGLTLDDVRERARAFLLQIEAIDSAIAAELRGIAVGARQQLEDIVAVNCRTELMYGASRGNRAATECTTIVALPSATRNKGLIVGKNWDWRSPVVDSIVLLRVRQTDKPALSLIV